MRDSPAERTAFHRRSKELFLTACDLDEVAARAMLSEACGSEPEMWVAVEQMLAADRAGSTLLEASPAADLARDEGAGEPVEIPGFRLTSCLGHGAMGAVWEAEQESPSRRVAIKLMQVLGADAERRFELEGEILGRMSHPGIAQIYGAGSVMRDGVTQNYLVMECVDGVTLLEYARRHELSTRARIELMLQVCDAVAHAHAHGVVHRDLKPANVLVDAEGRVRVLDFGVARLLEDEERSFRTHAGMVVGTLAYMSPEQAEGSADIDARADVYTLGAMLYELLAQRLPVDVGSLDLMVALRRIARDEPTLLGSIDPRLRGDLETIVCTALSKEPQRRYASAVALADDLRRHLTDEPVLARAPSLTYRLRKWSRRNRSVSTGLLVGVIAVLLGGAILLRSWGELTEEVYRARLWMALAAADAMQPANARELLAAADPASRGWEWRMLAAETDTLVCEHPDVEPFDVRDLDDGQAVVLDTAGAVWMWDAQTTELRELAPAAPAGAVVLALGPRGSRTVYLVDGELVLRDRDGREEARVVCAEAIPVGGRPAYAALDPRGAWCVFATEDRRILRASFADGELTEIPTGNKKVWQVGIDPDGRTLVTLLFKEFRTWDLESLAPLAHYEFGPNLQGSPRRRCAFDFDGDGGLLVHHEGGYTRLGLRERRLGERVPSGVMHRSTRRLSVNGSSGLLVLISGEVFVAASDDGEITRALPAADIARWVARGDGILSAPKGSAGLRVDQAEPRRVLEHGEVFAYDVSYHPSGAVLAACDLGGSVVLWSVATGRLLAETRLPWAARGVEFSSDGRHIAIATQRPLMLRVLGSPRPLLTRTTYEVFDVAFSPDGRRLAASLAARMIVLDSESGEILHAEQGGFILAPPVFDPSGRFLVRGTASVLEIVDTSNWTSRRVDIPNDAGRVSALRFADEGRSLFTGWSNGALQLRTFPSLELQHELTGHRSEVFDVAVSPDGERVFSGGRDGLLRVFDFATGTPMASFDRHDNYIHRIALAPTGEAFATASGDGSVRVWDPTPMRERWRKQKAVEAARPAAAELVDRLTAELGELLAVEANLRADASLADGLRIAAQEEVLRRLFQATFR